MYTELFKLNGLTVQSFIILTSLCFMAVFLCVSSDFVSGILRCRRQEIPISSRALRNTIRKLIEYYCTLFVFSIIGAMVQYALEIYNAPLPKIPIFSIFISICICLIEFKSILENMQDSTKKNARALFNMFKQLDPKDKEKTILSLLEFLDNDK